MGCGCSHAWLCARPEATRGHYDARDEILRLAHLADPSAATETLGLIPSAPTLRPADILTSAAVPSRLAALDVGITSPDASGAGDDCCEAMFQRKLSDYGAYRDEMCAKVKALKLCPDEHYDLVCERVIRPCQ